MKRLHRLPASLLSTTTKCSGTTKNHNHHQTPVQSRLLPVAVCPHQHQQQTRMSATFVPTPAGRLDGSTPSIWVDFTAMAKECGAVNIGQGFPDYGSCPQHVLDGLASAAQTTQMLSQYTRGFGHPRLVNNLAKLYSELLGRPIDPMKEILVTVGAYQALFYSIFAFVNPGDEVLLIEPFYDCYHPQVKMAGAVPVCVSLKLPSNAGDNPHSTDMKLDFDELESKISSKTKVMVINNPHNPSGKIFSREELTRLADLAKRHNIIVVADEVYEWLVYPGNEMIRFASLPGMADRTITIGSVGKTFSLTGWKIGWALASRPIMEQLEYAHQNCVYTTPTTTQEAVGQAFERELELRKEGKSYFQSIAAELQPKRDKMVEMVRAAGLKPIIPDSGYFMMMNASQINDKMGDFGDPKEPKDYRFVRWLTKEKKLAGIPMSAFYSPEHKANGEEWIRFCFFKKDETLDAADEILKKL